MSTELQLWLGVILTLLILVCPQLFFALGVTIHRCWDWWTRMLVRASSWRKSEPLKVEISAEKPAYTEKPGDARKLKLED